jgi:plasmid stabilization system protein ParE
MDFSVEMSDPAKPDIDEAFAYIAQDSFEAAVKWCAGLDALILSLEDMHHRFALIPEATALRTQYRSALYHSHRIVYRIEEAKHSVFVVRVYHGARRPLTRQDLDV